MDLPSCAPTVPAAEAPDWLPARPQVTILAVSAGESQFTVNVLFFGRVREITGLCQEAAEVPAGATLGDLFERYAKRFPKLGQFRASLVASRNQEFAAWDARLSSGDDIAFIPPVSGG